MSLVIIIIVIIIIDLLVWAFFTPVLANGLSLESERERASSSPQDSSRYSGRSQQYCCLDGLHLFPYFQDHQAQYQSFLRQYRAHELQLESPSL